MIRVIPRTSGRIRRGERRREKKGTNGKKVHSKMRNVVVFSKATNSSDYSYLKPKEPFWGRWRGTA